MPRVSVVIRAKNEARYIGDTIAAIQGQKYRDFEIIVVDSGSTDSTPEIALQYGAKLISIDPKQFTYGRALNLGVQHSQGDLIISLSAHATPESSNWMGSLVSGFLYPRAAGVYGRHIPRSNASTFELLGMYLSGVTSKERRIQVDRARFSNANGAFRRDLWEMLPFDDELPGAEDIDWARQIQRMGYVIVYEPDAAVFHSHGEPLLKLIRRQLHDQPVILRAYIAGLLTGQPVKRGDGVRSRGSIAKLR
ncbi:MAG: glycosyltransferase [Chloroflexota bacterium]